MSAPVGVSYDEVPYDGFALCLTHPNHLAALARLFAMTPPEVATCRVLEVGCARGENLIPMAESLPRARFIGIDLSPRQIAEGQAAIAELGLENIELRDQSLMDLDPDLGPFDFILAHGVFSWVSEPVQDRLLQLCAERLTPQGLAYLSYNTHPGWYMGSMVRDMMLFHTRGLSGARDRVRASRDLLQILARALARSETPYARALKEEAELIASRPDFYVYHEYLEDSNRPMYFHEFVDRVAGHGLHYLAEAQLGTMGAAQPPDRLQPFGGPDDWLGREQYYDFLKGQSFRQAVLCRSGVACSREPTAEGIPSLRIVALVRPAAASPVVDANLVEEFRNFQGGCALSTNDPLIRAALWALCEAWPASLPFDTLWARTEARLIASAPGDPARRAATPAQLAEALLAASVHEIVELLVHEPAFTTEVRECPQASAVARRQAGAGQPVANLRHRMITLMDFDRLVLPRLDGRRDRRALLGELQAAIADGVLTLQSEGRTITDPAEDQPILARLLEESLRRLAAGALLVE